MKYEYGRAIWRDEKDVAILHIREKEIVHYPPQEGWTKEWHFTLPDFLQALSSEGWLIVYVKPREDTESAQQIWLQREVSE